MALSDLIAQHSGDMGAATPIPHPASPADEPATRTNGGGSGAEDNSQKGDKPSVEEPWGVAQVVTPAGLEIYYQAGPKRLYRVNGDEKPSVSTVNEVLEKGGLSWYGMKVGVAGTLKLAKPGDLNQEWEDLHHDGPVVAEMIKRLQANDLDVNKVRDSAGTRGTNVHTALEVFADKKVMPDPELYPENERGYVQGLVAFLNDANPVPFYSELMVASLDGYAGRFDLVANLDFAGEVVTKTYPKRKPIRSEVKGKWLLDLKTSKDVYPSYHLQLAAYRKAMVECGYPEVDHVGVVRVTEDGRYELVEGRATYEGFRSVLDTYHVIKGLK